MIPGKLVKGMGGVVSRAQNIIVTMTMRDKYGSSKLLDKGLPLTGVNCVKKIVTDLAVLSSLTGAFHLLESSTWDRAWKKFSRKLRVS